MITAYRSFQQYFHILAMQSSNSIMVIYEVASIIIYCYECNQNVQRPTMQKNQKVTQSHFIINDSISIEWKIKIECLNLNATVWKDAKINNNNHNNRAATVLLCEFHFSKNEYFPKNWISISINNL